MKLNGKEICQYLDLSTGPVIIKENHTDQLKLYVKEASYHKIS